MRAIASTLMAFSNHDEKIAAMNKFKELMDITGQGFSDNINDPLWNIFNLITSAPVIPNT